MIIRRWLASLMVVSLLEPSLIPPALAQTSPVQVQAMNGAGQFDVPQLDALLAPIALYPDQLLTQILMAATFETQLAEAGRWLNSGGHNALNGDALKRALQPMPWDPSVKSLIPFPQVLGQLIANPDWSHQLGYAFSVQQKDVLDSVQRLRRQAQAQGQLHTTPQLVVQVQPQPYSAPPIIVIMPAQPSVIYVPVYSPTVVYGIWPYPSYPPIYLPPPPGYYASAAVIGALAFGVGVAIANNSSYYGWSNCNWHSGSVTVNSTRWNSINVNHTQINSSTWNANTNRPPGQSPANRQRPPGGPVGQPTARGGVPANAVGRQNVAVPSSAVKPAARTNGAGAPAGNRQNPAPGSRPASSSQAASRPANRPSPHAAVSRPPAGGSQAGGAQRTQPQGSQRPSSSMLGSAGDGRNAGAFQQRGAQSRQAGGFGGQQPGGGFGGGAARGGRTGSFNGGSRGRR